MPGLFHRRNFCQLQAKCVGGNQALSSSGIKFIFSIKTADTSLNFAFATHLLFGDTIFMTLASFVRCLNKWKSP